MNKELNLITSFHNSTKRNYFERMANKKVLCMKIAKKFGKDFWDGERKYGYGGYKYISGLLEPLAKSLINLYNLTNTSSVLDVGCGKGFLLFEIKKKLPQLKVSGFDISNYAIKNSKIEIRNNLFVHKAENIYPFKNKTFDLVLSINTLHNLGVSNLKKALIEIERVGKKKYIVVESYRNEQELFNLQCWALTGSSFFSKDDWEWLFKEFNYKGEFELIYFC
jgi:SAM-dependent methyltransferase